MYGYRNTVKLCMLEYLMVILAHSVYGFIKFGLNEGLFVLVVAAVMVPITFLFSLLVKNEEIVITGIYVSSIIATTVVGSKLHTIGHCVLIFMCMLCALTIFMKEKIILNSVIISLITFVLYGIFFWDEIAYSIQSPLMYAVYCLCYFAASLNLYILVKYAKRYMKGMEEKTEEAERLNESKMKFLANMSHEIRTPMNAILGMSELNLREDLSPQVKENSENIHDSAKILLTIVNDILDYSKMENGKMDIVPVTYSISHLVKETAGMMNLRLADKDVELRVSLDENIPDNLYGDEVRFRQILYNLLSNATNFTDHGYILLDIKGEKQSNDNIKIIVSVTDSGIGIRKEDMNKLFTSFQQLDSHKSHKREGTGLGLAISKELVTLMGGSITVESTYGVGSKFTFDIIQRIAKVQDKLSYTEAETQKTEPKVLAPDAKVLVVDDNMVNLKVASGLLKTFDLKVDTAKSGRECLEILKNTRDYDIIFLDHMMPELDGIETLNLIRADNSEYMQKVPVIALTANVMNGVRDMFISEGFNDFVPKPIDISWVNTILRKYLPLEKQR